MTRMTSDELTGRWSATHPTRRPRQSPQWPREGMMATAREAREWAHTALRGIGDSLYTPFCGLDGNDIDWAAYRALVRYCVSDLSHPLLG
jgi:hypothetical protein